LPAVVHSFTDTIKNQTQRNNSSGEKANLKLNRGLLGLALAFVIVFSVASLVQKQKDVDAAFQVSAHTALTEKLNVRAMYCSLDYPLPHYNILVFPMAGNVEIAVTEKALHPDNSTRTQIYSFISANPGVQFRGICSGLGLSIGVVQFHLAQLQKSGLITSFCKGRYKRFFAAGKFTRKEMETIATLRLSTVKEILKSLLHTKRLSHHELAVQLKISSQGLTWQMNRLRETGIIQENRNGLNVTYTIETSHIPLLTAAITLIE
jgi:predicted transcriptional regulator